MNFRLAMIFSLCFSSIICQICLDKQLGEYDEWIDNEGNGCNFYLNNPEQCREQKGRIEAQQGNSSTKTQDYQYSIQFNTDQAIISLNYLPYSSSYILLICFTNSLKIYSEDGKHQYLNFELQLNPNSVSEQLTHFFCSGTVFNKNNKVSQKLNEIVMVGNSLGKVISLEETQQKNKQFINKIVVSAEQFGPINNVLALDNIQSIVLSNANGGLLWYQLHQEKLELAKISKINYAELFSYKTSLEETNLSEPQTIVTCLCELPFEGQLNQAFLAVGYFTGKIKVFKLSTQSEQILEINAHARLLTCLDVQIKNYNEIELMSGSEDTYLNFWKLELNDSKDSALCCLEASLKVSFRIADQMIVGAQYFKSSNETIIGIYDAPDITLLRYLK